MTADKCIAVLASRISNCRHLRSIFLLLPNRRVQQGPLSILACWPKRPKVQLGSLHKTIFLQYLALNRGGGGPELGCVALVP